MGGVGDMEMIQSMLSNIWYIFSSIEPLLTVLISLGTLLAVIFGFSKFNEHTRKLEGVQTYKEFKEIYEKFKLRLNIDSYIEKYKNTHHQLHRIYIDQDKTHKYREHQPSEESKRELAKNGFDEIVLAFLNDTIELLETINKVWSLMTIFDLQNNQKIISIIYEDIVVIDEFMYDTLKMQLEHQSIKNYDNSSAKICGKICEFPAISQYKFEGLVFDKYKISRYFKLAKKCLDFEDKINGVPLYRTYRKND